MQKVDQVYCSLSANWDGGIKCKNSQDLVLSISTQLMHSDELSNYKANIMGYGCGTNSIYNGSTARGWVQWVFMSENALHREDKFLLFVSAPFLIMRLFFSYRQLDWHTNHACLSLIVANFSAVHKSQLCLRRSIQNSKEILKEWDLPQEPPSSHWSISAV